MARNAIAATPLTLAVLLAVDAVSSFFTGLIAALALETGGTDAVSTLVMASDASGTVAPQRAAVAEPSLLASLFATASNFPELAVARSAHVIAGLRRLAVARMGTVCSVIPFRTRVLASIATEPWSAMAFAVLLGTGSSVFAIAAL